jgi:two-component system, response regulator FlrC
VVPLTIPPLRARPEDIAPLIDHFVCKHHPQNDGGLPCFDADAMQKMILWQWPGNVRELENTIQRALLIRGSDSMGAELLLLEEQLAGGAVSPAAAQLVGLTVKELEERLIAQTLQHVNQNRTHAAEMLGISIRTLRNKLREYRQGET